MSKSVQKISGAWVFGACAVIAAGVMMNPLAWEFKRLETADYLRLLSTLFFVALILERALEVYVRALYAPEAERIQRELDRCQDALDFKDKQRRQVVELETAEINFNTELMQRMTPARRSGDAAGDPGGVAAGCLANIDRARDERRARMAELDREAARPFKEHDEAHERLMQHRIETRLAVLKWSTLTGLVLGAMGFRSLTAILDPASLAAMSPLQFKLVTMADIILTGGLLAGGSEGIHKLMQAVTTFLDASTSGNRERARR